MWLLKSRWSNPMKHLIPYLQDDRKAADYLRQLRWPDGVKCPRCGSDAAELRERCDNGLQRFNCVPCAVRLGQQFAMFTDWTSSIFEESKLRPFEWLLVMGLWQLKLNATEIAAAADIQERTAQRCINLLDGGIYETYHLDPTRQLEHQVEADECYQSAGSKGLAREVERRDREPRQRGLQLRGRATAELGRPPLLGLVQRRDKTDQDAPAAQVYLEVLENVRTATIKPIITAKVKVGAQFFTDEYNIYHFTEADYDHRTVNHGAGEYARRDPDGTCVHCNTMEGLWSSLRNFLDRFKGISQRFLHLRVARYEFLHNHGHLNWRQTFEATLRSIFSTTGDYWRRMAHQHRRMPLTLCYR
jgi:transposase-like protein